jgi:hypothetical protein
MHMNLIKMLHIVHVLPKSHQATETWGKSWQSKARQDGAALVCRIKSTSWDAGGNAAAGPGAALVLPLACIIGIHFWQTGATLLAATADRKMPHVLMMWPLKLKRRTQWYSWCQEDLPTTVLNSLL